MPSSPKLNKTSQVEQPDLTLANQIMKSAKESDPLCWQLIKVTIQGLEYSGRSLGKNQIFINSANDQSKIMTYTENIQVAAAKIQIDHNTNQPIVNFFWVSQSDFTNKHATFAKEMVEKLKRKYYDPAQHSESAPLAKLLINNKLSEELLTVMRDAAVNGHAVQPPPRPKAKL